MKAMKYAILLSTLLLLFFLFVVPSARAASQEEAQTNVDEATLSPPTFTLSPLSFAFDGKPHILKVENLFHEFEEEGFYTYSWYKDGVLLGGSASTLAIKNVSDSGAYTVSVTFTYEGQSVSAHSGEVRVDVLPMRVATPEILPKIYEGTHLYASIPQSPYYTATKNEGGLNAGEYPVVLSLNDVENCVWDSTNQNDPIEATFQILKAQNDWIEETYVLDTYLGTPPTFGGYAKFGTPAIMYSKEKEGPFSLVMPGSTGALFARISVEGTSNYTSLTSPIYEIEVRQNAPVAIRIDANPDKWVYTAFETVDLNGIRVSVTHLDGSVTLADVRSLRVIYDTYPNSLSATDSGVTVAYGDLKARLPLEVKKATYSLDQIVFQSENKTYNGEFLTITPGGKAPVGKDGIPLKMEVIGGGTDTGSYTITLSFSTESVNYECPSSKTTTLNILPKKVTISWEMLTFVYDNSEKVPKASYLNVFGNIEYAEVEGGKINAGTEYIATAKMSKNYIYENPTTTFSIEKGEYDMSGVFWSASSFVFDNTEKTPVLSGLPQGVSVLQYDGNRGINAGEYTATATLLYDATNYNPPLVPTLKWQILKTSYDLSSFEILGGLFVYDGKPHSPTIVGTLPLGLDGCRLEVTFSDTVTNVEEGKKEITATFSTSSGNYLLPNPITVSLAISPAPIEVEWKNLAFTYDGKSHLPEAIYNDLPIAVEGEMVLAGEYTATAQCKNQNYYIINPKIVYVIQKAKNEWLLPLEIQDGYTSKNPTPKASAKYGEVTFTYYDANGNEVKNPKDRAGNYTCIATVEESENYTLLSSSPLSFTIHEVVAVETVATLNPTLLFAYETLSPSHFTVKKIYNDGSESLINDFRIEYENASSLRFMDTYVRIVTEDASIELPIDVRKATFDPDTVTFSFSTVTYKEEGHILRVVSLPEGVTLISLSEDTFLNVGEYTVVAIFDLDKNNYEGEGKVTHTVNVKKQIISSPTLPSLTYTGEVQAPILKDTSAYQITDVEEGKNAGQYRVTLLLKDKANTAFADTEGESLTLYYTIEKAPLTITLSDVTIYRDGGQSDFTYFVSEGALFSGDVLNVVPFVGETVGANVEHENYNITLKEGRVIYSSRNTPMENENEFWWLAVAVLVILLLLLLLYFIPSKRRKVTSPNPTAPEPSPTSPTTDPVTPTTSSPISSTDVTQSTTTPPPASAYALADASFALTEAQVDPETETEATPDSILVVEEPTISSTPQVISEGTMESTPEAISVVEEPTISSTPQVISEGTVESTPEAISVLEEPSFITVAQDDPKETEEAQGVSTHTTSPFSDLICDEESVVIFDVFPTMEFETQDEDNESINPQEVEMTADATEITSQVTTSTATTASVTTPVKVRKARKKKRKKKAMKEKGLVRFFEFIFAPWHKHAGKRAERTVAHTTQENEEYAYRTITPETTEYFGITEEEADRLLSDRSAEALLEHRNAPIVTYGKRRAIINIDTLSEHFSSGDRVDIEILKSRMLIPYDTLHIKVLARGAINKPLYVFANEFSLCAIKMLLLSGGKAIKQKTKSVGFSVGGKGKGRKK